MFDVYSTQRLKEVQELHKILKKKEELEHRIAELIRSFEDQTGFAIDIVKYQRDITLPIHKPHYINLSIIISDDELRSWGEEAVG